MKSRVSIILTVIGVFSCGMSPAFGQINVPSDGSDGTFTPSASTQIDLSLAPTGAWDQPGAGTGVYDPDMWAVVFKYSFVQIPAGVTVTFKNHPSGAPVVWLVDGPVTISGTLDLGGTDGHGNNVVATFATGGPGGFKGGRGSRIGSSSSGGFGPGGAAVGGAVSRGSGAGYASQGSQGANGGGIPGMTYGNSAIIPLLGGSGGAGGQAGSGSNASGGGGGGGGAILIAARTLIQLDGTLMANGAYGNGTYPGGAGSGGAIRLIADRVQGSGILSATGAPSNNSGGAGGDGRIRVEANINGLVDLGSPLYSFVAPSDPPEIWPPADAPSLSLQAIGGLTIPSDPQASTVNADVTLVNQPATKFIIQADNVPTTSTVEVRIVPNSGATLSEPAFLVSGDDVASTWSAVLALPNGISSIQVHATLP